MTWTPSLTALFSLGSREISDGSYAPDSSVGGIGRTRSTFAGALVAWLNGLLWHEGRDSRWGFRYSDI